MGGKSVTKKSTSSSTQAFTTVQTTNTDNRDFSTVDIDNSIRATTDFDYDLNNEENGIQLLNSNDALITVNKLDGGVIAAAGLVIEQALDSVDNAINKNAVVLQDALDLKGLVEQPNASTDVQRSEDVTDLLKWGVIAAGVVGVAKYWKGK